MELVVTVLTGLTLLAILIVLFGPRPTLDPSVPATCVPAHLSAAELATWLAQHEADQGTVIEGTEASIEWADGAEVQDLCLLYVHGFSASRQETSPLSERIAAELGANAVFARLAGHGLETGAMEATAEQWLQSMVDSWEIASRIGRKVIIVAVSTGAPLSIWLHHYVAAQDKVHSFIFLAPNFKVRNPFAFLLTWPWSPIWLTKLLGEHSWEPENERAARFWTHRYSSHAVIEMQKVVDWVQQTRLDARNIPLATLYMEGDPTISHEAAVAFHEAWEAKHKNLLTVTLDADNPQHVFVGDITAPHRVDWCVERCVNFIKSV